MTETSELRQRKAAPTKEDEAPRKTRPKSRADEEDEYTPWVDILRVLTSLFVASCALSYLISSGESLFWGLQHKPKYMRLDWWKSHFVRSTLLPLRLRSAEALANLGNSRNPPSNSPPKSSPTTTAPTRKGPSTSP